MADYIAEHGNAFLAHRLRRTSDRIVDQISALLGHMRLNVPPRGASMLLLLDERGPIGVVEIAHRLGLSHPLIVRMAQRFEELGLVTIETDSADARRRQLTPTRKAQREAATIREFNGRLDTMFDALFEEVGCDLLAVLDRMDAALTANPILARVAALDEIEGAGE